MATQRPGPRPEPHDAWDSATTGLHGLVRRHRPARRFLWLALILVATALVSTIGVRVLPSDDQRDASPDRAPGARPVASSTQVSTGVVGIVVIAPALPAGSPSRSSGSSETPAGSPPPVVAPAVLPLVFEAEAPSLRLRRAEIVQVAGASGGQAVRFTATNGEVRIDALALPANGTYRVTLVYVPGGAWSGDVRGFDGPVRVNFAAGTDCCASLTTDVVLTAGGALRVGPSSGEGPFPAIDRIIIDLA